tara:strand:+ start:55868 stop:56335 length:468 start_codon:yes stop_codon:yes gene_type:complete
MKAGNIVIAVVIFTFASITASQSFAMSSANNDSTVVTKQANKDKLFDRFENGLIFGLSSDVLGVVESSIYNAVNYKIAYPEFTSVKVVEELNRVAINGDNHSVRYRAYLALAYYKNQSEFESPNKLLSLLDHKNQDGIFFYLQDEIHEGKFTSNM